MVDATTQVPAAQSGGRRPLLLGGLAAVVAGGGAFALFFLGILPPADTHEASDGHEDHFVSSDIAFVPLETLVVSLGPLVDAKHLLITIQLEVAAQHKDSILFLKPRIADVLNGYLRALDPQSVEERSSLIRLRGQMLRRVQLVVGDGMVQDLLITEFVLN